MPQMANITVKASNGTTDVIYNGIVPSAGDKVPARWAAVAASPIQMHRPTLSLVMRDNGPRNGRVFSAVFKMPIIETVNGIPTVVATFPMTISGTVPTNVDSAKVKEGIYQGTNLFVAALFRQQLEEGYSAT
jgi:hypothetical protein